MGVRESAATLRIAALSELTALGGNQSACTRAKNGDSFPAYKFHEGRLAAASELMRNRGDEVTPEVALVALGVRWQAEVERRVNQGPDWRAYAAGGLDAASELMAKHGVE